MKTPEEIKYTLHWCRNSDANNQCLGCPYKKIEDCEYALEADAYAYIRQLEDHIGGLTKMVPRWISVKERLPEQDQTVLLIAHGWKNQSIYVGKLCHMEPVTSWLTGITSKESEWEIEGWSYLKTPFVTHWMEIPQPPKEE